MSWMDLKQLVKEEKAKRNPVAMAIDQLKLETNKITLRLRWVWTLPLRCPIYRDCS